MIELTHTNGEKVNIDPDYIIMIEDHDATIPEAKAEITLNNTILLVCETRQEVVRKVLEWRLEMEAYKQSVLGNNFNISADCASRLQLLAGLEESA